MPVSVKWPPLSGPTVDHYNIYRGDTSSGPFTKIGEMPQPDEPLPEQLQFTDATGSETKHYRIEPVDEDGIPGQPSNVFQPRPKGAKRIVFDRILNAAGKGVANIRVEAKLSKAVFFNNLVVPTTVSTVTDNDGFWSLELFPNSLMEPDDSDYVFVIPGVSPSKRGVVPDGGVDNPPLEFKAVVGTGP